MPKIEFTNRKDLLIELVRTNFKLRYNNSVLGFVWVLLRPLLTFVILYIVFSNLFGRGSSIENYPIFLLTGITIYTFFSESLIFGLNALLDKAGIILKVNFPRELAVFSAVIMALINFSINLVILLLFTLLKPIDTNLIAILYFTFVMSVMFMAMLGIAFFTSIWLVKLRDLKHVFDLLTQLLLYLTPVIYTLEMLPDKLARIIMLNPLTIIVLSARDALMWGKITNVNAMLILTGISIIILIIGNIYFRNQVKKIAEHF